MQTLTVAEVAETTGLTRKAVRRRIERGTLRAVRGHDGLRRVPVSELERAGLTTPAGAPSGAHALAGYPGGDAAARELVAGLREQERELAELRALTAEAESLRDDRRRLEAELHQLRARIRQLEAQLAAPRWRRFFRRSA